GRVVLGVLAEVAVGARDLDLLGDLLPAPRLEVLELGAEAVVGLLAQPRLGHGRLLVCRACGLDGLGRVEWGCRPRATPGAMRAPGRGGTVPIGGAGGEAAGTSLDGHVAS